MSYQKIMPGSGGLERLALIATELAKELAAEHSSTLSREIAQPTAPAVREILRARRARADYFPGELFADPAWDILLDLYHSSLSQQRVPVSALCIAANVPATTALRYIQALEQKEMVMRHADPFDGRRSYISLTETTLAAFAHYFSSHPLQAAR